MSLQERAPISEPTLPCAVEQNPGELVRRADHWIVAGRKPDDAPAGLAARTLACRVVAFGPRLVYFFRARGLAWDTRSKCPVNEILAVDGGRKTRSTSA